MKGSEYLLKKCFSVLHVILVQLSVYVRDKSQKSSIHYLYCLSVRVTGVLESFPADFGREARYTHAQVTVLTTAPQRWPLRNKNAQIHIQYLVSIFMF